YPDIYALGDHLSDILEFAPTGLEGMDSVLLEAMALKRMHPRERRLLPEGGSWLMVEFGGEDVESADAQARALADHLSTYKNAPGMKIFSSTAEQNRLWKLRESGLGATSRAPAQGNTYPGWEDAAVPPTKIG